MHIIILYWNNKWWVKRATKIMEYFSFYTDKRQLRKFKSSWLPMHIHLLMGYYGTVPNSLLQDPTAAVSSAHLFSTPHWIRSFTTTVRQISGELLGKSSIVSHTADHQSLLCDFDCAGIIITKSNILIKMLCKCVISA